MNNAEKRNNKPEVGDVVRLSDGTVCIVTQVSPDGKMLKGVTANERNGRLEIDPHSKEISFSNRNIADIRKNDDLRRYIEDIVAHPEKRGNLVRELKDSVELYQANKELNREDDNEKTKNEKPEKKKQKEENTRNASMSVITHGDVDGYIRGGNSYETIITGETKDGSTFTVRGMGNNISRATIEAHVDSRVESADLTNEQADETAAHTRVQEAIYGDTEVVEISRGPTIDKTDLNRDDDSSEHTKVEFDAGDNAERIGADPTDQSLSLDEILEQTGGISEDSPLYASSYEEPEIDDDFEPELTLI